MDDGDGIAEAGEFMTLEEAHISSIDLGSDNISYDTVGGDVTVFGTASYTLDDGTVGDAVDAGFYTGADVQVDATMDALLAMADDSTNTTGDEGTDVVQLASVEDAMSDVSGEAAVDAIVDQYSDDGSVNQLAESGGSVHDLLDMGIADGSTGFHQGLTLADMTDDAAALAVTA